MSREVDTSRVYAHIFDSSARIIVTGTSGSLVTGREMHEKEGVVHYYDRHELCDARGGRANYSRRKMRRIKKQRAAARQEERDNEEI